LKKIDSLEAREELEVILAQKEYQVYYVKEKNTLQDLLERLQDWLSRLFSNFTPNIEVAENASEWVSYGMVAVGIGIVILLIVIFSSRMVRENRYFSKPLGTQEELVLSSQSHLKEADRLFAQGNLRSALRHQFLALILYLNEIQLIEARVWKTNGEYIDELDQHTPELVDRFKKIALTFEATWYGGRVIATEDYLDYQDQVGKLLEVKQGEEGDL
jgi:hypothetical protein